MQKAPWSTAVAASALLALPVVASAQSTQSTPQQNPPAQSQPPSGQVDQTAAKTHLSEARDTLSQVTSMPEAAKLQGAARTQVSQLISDFNAMITTQSDWRAGYAKVDADLTALLGPDAASDQPVATSGGDTPIDPAIRAKLGEFRTRLKAFEKAAGGSAAPSASTAVAPAGGSEATPPAGAVPPSAPTPTTPNPATPGEPKPASSSPVGTSGVSPASPTANMDSADRARAESAVNTGANADAQKELDAIFAILSGSKTGALTAAQTAQLKKHVENLRVLLAHR